MNPIFKKLNFKEQKEVLVINAPHSFYDAMETMQDKTSIIESLDLIDSIDFTIIFVTRKIEIDNLVPQLIHKLNEDGLLWFCYPKASSKKYNCDFNRDTGWQSLGEHGFEGVRMVAIDQDWSALRFRNVKYIKKMTRNFAMSKEGKEKVRNREK